jgi:Replication-relaxation
MSVPLTNRQEAHGPVAAFHRRARGPQLMVDPDDRAKGRDGALLRWVGRHGVVTPEQIAHRWFGAAGGMGTGDGMWAAWRRLRALEQHGLIRRDSWYYREPQAIRLTGAGAQVAAATDPDGQFDLGPARLVLAEIRHTLGLVDLTEQLLAQHPGSTLTTERQLRAQARRELRTGKRKAGDGGRTPDGVLHLASGDAVALELDRTDKRAKDYQAIIDAYKRGPYKRIWWFVSRRKVEKLRELAALDQWAKSRVEVTEW